MDYDSFFNDTFIGERDFDNVGSKARFCLLNPKLKVSFKKGFVTVCFCFIISMPGFADFIQSFIFKKGFGFIISKT